MKRILTESSIEIYQSIIEHNPDAIIVLTNDMKISQINNVVTEKFGYTEAELAEINPQQLISPEQIEKVRQHFNQVLKGTHCETEFDAIHKNGELLHMQIKSIPLIVKTNLAGIFCVVKDKTELINTKKTLNQIEGKFKAIFNSSFDAMDLLDLDGNIIDVNRGFESLYGWTREELIGKPLPIIPENKQVEGKSIVERVKLGEEIHGLEVDVQKKDGSPVKVSLTLSPVRDEQGKMIAVSGIARDITEQKQLETSLRESEERYRKLVEYSPTGVLVQRKDCIYYANPAALKILKETSFSVKPIHDFIHPDDQELYDQRILEIENGHVLPFLDIKMIRRDGKVIFAEIGGVSLKSDGFPVVLLLFRDVTERRNVEQALRESEERYRLIAENVTDLVVMCDANGVITYASPSHEFVLGFTPEEYEHHHAFDFVHPDDIMYRQNLFVDILRKKDNKVLEFRHRHANGNWIWIEENVVPIFDEQGNLLHFLGLGREITERKRYDEKLNFMAYHDTLTGLPNRRYFKEQLELTLKNAELNKREFAVIFIDLDDFKKINDSYGHDVGDELLKQFAHKIEWQLEEQDIFARLGGDEFTILIPDLAAGKHYARTLAERILDTIREPWQIEMHKFPTTSSMGIAFYPKDGITRQALMKNADVALYKAKEKGKNKIVVY